MAPLAAYDRQAAYAYAEKWAFQRNPRFFKFDGIGGDCTNFISQCLLAGGAVMNYTKDIGWYYNSPTDRAAAWSSVAHLHNFLTRAHKRGPVASAAPLETLTIGDIIQLGNEFGKWYHTLLVTQLLGGEVYVSTHTYDAHLRPLSSYQYAQARGLHIEGIRV